MVFLLYIKTKSFLKATILKVEQERKYQIKHLGKD